MSIEDEYDVASTFETRYKGVCSLNHSHRIKRGDIVARLARKNNPLIPIPGVVCQKCIDEIRGR